MLIKVKDEVNGSWMINGWTQPISILLIPFVPGWPKKQKHNILKQTIAVHILYNIHLHYRIETKSWIVSSKIAGKVSRNNQSKMSCHAKLITLKRFQCMIRKDQNFHSTNLKGFKRSFSRIIFCDFFTRLVNISWIPNINQFVDWLFP